MIVSFNLTLKKGIANFLLQIVETKSQKKQALLVVETSQVNQRLGVETENFINYFFFVPRAKGTERRARQRRKLYWVRSRGVRRI